MDTQEQLPPNSFQSQISALDGIISTSATTTTSWTNYPLQTGAGITYYGQDGQVVAITGSGGPTWVDYQNTDWVESKRMLTAEEMEKYYNVGILPPPEPEVDRGIFGLMQLVKDE